MKDYLLYIDPDIEGNIEIVNLGKLNSIIRASLTDVSQDFDSKEYP